MRATCATIGVFPEPPTRRLPTLTTGRDNDRRYSGRLSYQIRRRAATAAYRVLNELRINAPDGRVSPRRRRRRPAARARRWRRASFLSHRDWLRRALVRPRPSPPAGPDRSAAPAAHRPAPAPTE